MAGSAQETKEGLDSKSAFSLAKLRQSQEYRRASSKAYRFAKVTFTCSLLYCMSHYCHHRVCQRESNMKPETMTRRVQHSHLPEVGFTLPFLYIQT